MNYNSLNLKGTQKEIEEALADLEKTKEEKAKQTQPLFTLTAEEIMEVKCAIVNRIHDLEIMSKYSSNPDVSLLEGLKTCENLFKRLNDYGKEI